MIIVQVKEGENIERALKKFKRKFEKTGAVRNLWLPEGKGGMEGSIWSLGLTCTHYSI